ncbi:hypothetical protein NIES3275_01230 [Microchaete diplosiphon NIES-3275]|nr:hypothetical protein NIES3275_01230 [Microchaete diplosiphon NIES-3275]
MNFPINYERNAVCRYKDGNSIFKSGIRNFYVLLEDVAVSVAELGENAFVIQAVKI